MQSLNLFLLLVVVSSASACTYFCKAPGKFEYECCDDGNPYFTPETDETSGDDSVAAESEEKTEVDSTPDSNEGSQATVGCFYYCAYKGEVYCCGDSSRPIPESHDNHEGRCPEEEEQVCKSTGVFLNSKKVQGKTSGALRLVSGPGKEELPCASDGYCSDEEKCCASQCARKHICMKALDEEE